MIIKIIAIVCASFALVLGMFLLGKAADKKNGRISDIPQRRTDNNQN